MYGSTLQAGMFGVMVVERRAGVARLAALGREDRSDAPQPAAEERRPRAAADTQHDAVLGAYLRANGLTG